MNGSELPAEVTPRWLKDLLESPGAVDFHVALRRFECAYPDKPRFGEARRPSEEPLRTGQPPSAAFQSSAIASYSPAEEATTSEAQAGISPGQPAPLSAAARGASKPRLLVNFFGLWGPQGPLPLHLSEYARDRLRHVGDATLVRFADIFHHRMLLLFHRAWSKGEPTVARDRPQQDPFTTYVGAFIGVAGAASRNRDAFPDQAKLYYAGRFAAATRSAEGLSAVIRDHFGLEAAIEEFVGEWTNLPPECHWRLGESADNGTLGRTAVLGGRVWTRSHKFRVVLGPLSNDDFQRMLPHAEGVRALSALVRFYTNDEWAWDLRLRLAPSATPPMRLARGARLGWTTRVGAARAEATDLVVDPHTRRTQRIASKPSNE